MAVGADILRSVLPGYLLVHVGGVHESPQHVVQLGVQFPLLLLRRSLATSLSVP